MRIKNTPRSVSLQNIAIAVVILIMSLPLAFISETNNPALTILSFFPAVCIGYLAYEVINRYLLLKQMNSVLNLKYVDFLPDRVAFYFNRSNCNFVCPYTEVKQLKLEIVTGIITCRKFSGTAINHRPVLVQSCSYYDSSCWSYCFYIHI